MHKSIKILLVISAISAFGAFVFSTLIILASFLTGGGLGTLGIIIFVWIPSLVLILLNLIILKKGIKPTSRFRILYAVLIIVTLLYSIIMIDTMRIGFSAALWDIFRGYPPPRMWI